MELQDRHLREVLLEHYRMGKLCPLVRLVSVVSLSLAGQIAVGVRPPGEKYTRGHCTCPASQCTQMSLSSYSISQTQFQH